MLSLIEAHRDEIANLCRRFHARRLEVFGSAARGDFVAGDSDFDFLVEFDPAHKVRAFDDYFGLKEGLEALLGGTVDLVVDKAVRNEFVRAEIDRAREPVYGA